MASAKWQFFIDVGGTSSDVARIDTQGAGSDASLHGVEYHHQTVTAQVRIMTPMLAIETVAEGASVPTTGRSSPRAPKVPARPSRDR